MEMNVVIHNVLINNMQTLRIITIAFEFLVSFTLMKRPYEPLINFWMALFKALIYRIQNISSIFINSVVTKIQQALLRVISSLVDSGNNATHT